MQKQSRLKPDHRCRECTPLQLPRDSATRLTRTQAGNHGESATATQRTHRVTTQVSGGAFRQGSCHTTLSDVLKSLGGGGVGVVKGSGCILCV